MHCVALTNACLLALDILLPDETCLTDRSLLRSTHGEGHPRGRSPRCRTISRWCFADNHCMHRSGRPHTFLSACTSNPATSVMHTVIRLSRGYLLPTSRPAGHNRRTTKTAFPPTLDQYSSPDRPAGHQPTPEFQCSINADVPDALRGPTNACLWTLDIPLLAETCLNVGPLLRSAHGDCHPRGRSPRRRTASQRCISDNHCMHRSGGGRLFPSLASQSPPPGDACRYPTEPRTLATRLAPCGAQPTHGFHADRSTAIAPTSEDDDSLNASDD
ncbi:hypothetical protein LF1_00020 [Rubripirellula obstinata]|uniref:Uncharacterized protein n=1 Tax=Rubripirellula obstinata TaxID=406547 RepID=A0A5B1CBX3_9BACT|nr:hypothetical protein LF1_00020 [Rubripirellula obstinata]